MNDFLTFRDRKLSLWQSVVEEIALEKQAREARLRPAAPAEAAQPLSLEAVRQSVEARAATATVHALDDGQPLTGPQRLSGPAAEALEAPLAEATGGAAWECSRLALRLAWARVRGDEQTARKLAGELRFGSCDPLWLEAAERYVLYFVKDQSSIPYRSGGDYVLDVPLPAQATVALIGDWGTGTQTAVDLLKRVNRYQPDVLFHLGDIYYSGTLPEVQGRFLSLCQEFLGGGTRVLSLCGNHDVYSGGRAYYWLVDQLRQRASYFCVRNDHWQFLAMDTGYHDFNPFTVSSNVTYLNDDEAAWHRARVDEGVARGLRTVLLSHHQLFSAAEPIGNGAVNELLLSQFQDSLDRVDFWFWGHEHGLGIYEPFRGLARGRCLGCSAIPVFVANPPAPPPGPRPPLKSVQLGDDGTVYRHAYAIMKLDGRGARVAYYQDDKDEPLHEETVNGE